MNPALYEIALENLVPHPENSNHMSAETLRKLRRHIERTGRYEPLTVRPHPHDRGKFEALNGHVLLRRLRRDPLPSPARRLEPLAVYGRATRRRQRSPVPPCPLLRLGDRAVPRPRSRRAG